jgi:hypothetical protein
MGSSRSPFPYLPSLSRGHVNSAFIGTNLETDLRQDDIGTLVIVGLTTNHRVSTTARMAGNLGFASETTEGYAAFARRALDGTLRLAVHSAALSDLHQDLATVVDTAEVLRASSRFRLPNTFTRGTCDKTHESLPWVGFVHRPNRLLRRKRKQIF